MEWEWASTRGSTCILNMCLGFLCLGISTVSTCALMFLSEQCIAHIAHREGGGWLAKVGLGLTVFICPEAAARTSRAKKDVFATKRPCCQICVCKFRISCHYLSARWFVCVPYCLTLTFGCTLDELVPAMLYVADTNKRPEHPAAAEVWPSGHAPAHRHLRVNTQREFNHNPG